MNETNSTLFLRATDEAEASVSGSNDKTTETKHFFCIQPRNRLSFEEKHPKISYMPCGLKLLHFIVNWMETKALAFARQNSGSFTDPTDDGLVKSLKTE
jgi:hypothetical protein